MTLREYILHQMAEAKREMIEAVKDLPDGVLASAGPARHWPVAWIVQHCCLNVDHFLHFHMTGKYFLEHEELFRGWPLKEPVAEYRYPPSAELVRRWSVLWDAVMAGFLKLSDADLGEKLHDREPLVESCLRVINHTNAHLRAIWCLLGEQRIDSKYPEQHTWLAG